MHFSVKYVKSPANIREILHFDALKLSHEAGEGGIFVVQGGESLTFEIGCHIPSEISHSLNSFGILGNIFRLSSVHHIPVA